MVALLSKDKRPYNRAQVREWTRKQIEEDLNELHGTDEILPAVSYDTVYYTVSENNKNEQQITYPFHFEGRTLVIGKDKQYERRRKLEQRLSRAIQKGAEAENPKERRYWRNELMRTARKLRRFNYFPPGNMLVWPFYFQGERIRFGRPYEYGTPPSRYEKIVPYTKEYAPRVVWEKRSPFADFVLHFPEYGLRAFISRN